MPVKDDTQPIRPQPGPHDTQPKRPQGAPQRANSTGPGCLAWGLLSVAGGAFSLLIVFIAGLFGYLSGQDMVAASAQVTQQAFIDEQLTTWIPRDLASGNTALLGARIEGLASLTPAPPEVAGLIATGTQFAVENAATATPTITPTLEPTATPTTAPVTATATVAPLPTTDPALDEDAPLFDVNALYAEAQQQLAAEDYEGAVLTLEAIVAVDPEFRASEIEGLLFDTWLTRARLLLRSGDPSDLAAGIRAENEASNYGDTGDISFDAFIAGLYLDGQSKEELNPLGAITSYSNVFAQAPNFLDVRTKLFTLRVEVGDEYLAAFDFCPAAEQYQAALGIQPNNADVQTKLQTAQSSCTTGNPPPDSGTTDTTGDSAPAPIGQQATATPIPTETPSGPAPIGAR
ncbi:MAG: hypothetical protein AAF125_08205 [Chloroflexota bacterium]